ncbi:MAG: nucleoside-diphosphate sugar epimerase/dehydratase [Phaeodactylibacter sp.]|uniref:polysaccharide biosynthesis protein n=1 Tax=Phaeodactylibacter sp. TaxID=1940289 RepID=UPI0032EAFA14
MKLPLHYLPGSGTAVSGTASKVMILAIDLFAALMSFSFGLLLTDNMGLLNQGIFIISTGLVLLLSLRALSFYLFKTYLIIIRFAGLKDARNIFLAVLTSSLTFLLATYCFPTLLNTDDNWKIILVDTLALIALAGGFRLTLRSLADLNRGRMHNGASRINTVIFGAGELGAQLYQVLKQNVNHDYRVMAYFDDNQKVHKKHLNGIPVYNPGKCFGEVVKKYNIKTAIIAIGPSLTEERRIAFIDQCLEHKIKVKKVPVTEAWIQNNLQVDKLRDIKFEDLLNRPPITLSLNAIEQSIKGKTILVTGCAGSIGKEIVRQCLRFEPHLLIGADVAETPLAETALSFQEQIKAKRLKTVIADVRDEERMRRLFESHCIDYVFHAAAYKHVPIMEDHPEEAIKTNVQGSYNMARLSSEYKVGKFVMVSTDKAVNPSNVMGASKRIAELYVQSLNKRSGNETQFITTRFGNVLGSNGSVIPIFKKQIEKRQPVTVTHKEITRYFMTIPEACQLVLEAGSMGKGGEIFIFDMGKPVRIYDLAKKMIQMAGFTPGEEIEIQISGLRPGEKLYEELLDNGENTRPTHHQKIKIASVRECDHNSVTIDILRLIDLASDGAPPREIVRYMKDLVPEFTSQNSDFEELDRPRTGSKG